MPFTWKLQPLDSPSVSLGGKLPVQALELKHDIQHDDWEGSATLGLGDLFPGGGEGKALPAFTLGLGIGVNPFQFNFASGEVDNLQVPLPDGVFLQKVKVDLHLHPQLEIGGEMKLSAGPAIEGHSALSIDAGVEYKRSERQGFELTINGDVQLSDVAQLGSAHIKYDSTEGDARVSFGGTLGGSWGPVQASLNVNGDVTSDHIQATGDATLQAFGAGMDGKAVVSDAGFGACGSVGVGPFSQDVGFRHLFSTGETDFDGCAFTGLFTISRAADIAAAANSSIVRAGTARVEFAATGSTAPPNVVLTGPHGEHLQTPPTLNRIVIGAQGLSIADGGSHTTYFIIERPSAGTWKLTAAASGIAPVRFSRADAMRPVVMHARVSGRGLHRLLAWKLRAQPGTSVVFLEQGHAIERSLTQEVVRSGDVRFRASGPGGRRRVVALVWVSGLLRERLTVAGFRVHAPKLPRPHAASFRMRHGTVLIRWSPVPAASGYSLRILLGGRHLLLLNADTRRDAIVVRLPLGNRAHAVTVAAQFRGLNGPAVIARRRR